MKMRKCHYWGVDKNQILIFIDRRSTNLYQIDRRLNIIISICVELYGQIPIWVHVLITAVLTAPKGSVSRKDTRSAYSTRTGRRPTNSCGVRRAISCRFVESRVVAIASRSIRCDVTVYKELFTEDRDVYARCTFSLLDKDGNPTNHSCSVGSNKRYYVRTAANSTQLWGSQSSSIGRCWSSWDISWTTASGSGST